jgi:hypothetical protein
MKRWIDWEGSIVTFHSTYSLFNHSFVILLLQRRVLNLCDKYCDGHIPDTTHDPAFALPFDLDTVVSHILIAFAKLINSIY